VQLKSWSLYVQELEEPGQDTSRFDTLSPTVVKPRNKVHNVSEHNMTGLYNNFKAEATFEAPELILGQFEALVPSGINYIYEICN